MYSNLPTSNIFFKKNYLLVGNYENLNLSESPLNADEGAYQAQKRTQQQQH